MLRWFFLVSACVVPRLDAASEAKICQEIPRSDDARTAAVVFLVKEKMMWEKGWKFKGWYIGMEVAKYCVTQHILHNKLSKNGFKMIQ